MKTIKTFLAVVLMIASASFAKAQDAKYHLHDNAFQTAITVNNTNAGAVYAQSDFIPPTAKYHLHYNAFDIPTTTNNRYIKYAPLNSDFVSSDAKYHLHDFEYGSLTTATIKVYGECSFCKQHIEYAAKLKGVSSATWNESTRLLTVQYNDKITSLDQIEQWEAITGHDTEKYRADNVAYNNLPHCCHYQRKA